MLLKKSDLAENDRTFLNANLGNTEAAGADVDGGGYGVLGPEEGAVVHGGYGRGVALQQREVSAQSLHHKKLWENKFVHEWEAYRCWNQSSEKDTIL